MKLRRMKLNLLVAAALLAGSLTSCRIEPPLRLADAVDVEMALLEIVTDINLIWEIDPDWQKNWWYGWDEEDEARFGMLDYPVPRTYEARIYGLASGSSESWLSTGAMHVEGTRFTRRFALGRYEMLLWSNIESPDGTQVVRIDESDPSNILATTSSAKMRFRAPSYADKETLNNPEIFFAGNTGEFNVTRDPRDYDYFDSERKVWVKTVDAELSPLVYTYLVQIVLYNNRGAVTIDGIDGQTGVTSLASGVSVHTGHTLMTDVIVSYDMRIKRSLPARDGRVADIIGGKLTTFGLCDMEPWSRSRSTDYSGSRGDLRNHIMVNFKFNNGGTLPKVFEVTDQMQHQAHGGIITIEVDVSELDKPDPARPGDGSTFDPTIADRDEVEYNFDI